MTHLKQTIAALEAEISRYAHLLKVDVERHDLTLASYHHGVLKGQLVEWQRLLKEEARESAGK